MFDSESKAQYDFDLVQEAVIQPRRRMRRPAARRDGVVLVTDEGKLRLDVLGYEFPEALEGFDADWLVVRVQYERDGKKVRHKGAVLLADELAAWAERVASVSVHDDPFSFTEPNFQFECVGRDGNGDLTARLTIRGEPKDGNPCFETTLEIEGRAWNAFGRSLQRLARAFPQRSARCTGT